MRFQKFTSGNDRYRRTDFVAADSALEARRKVPLDQFNECRYEGSYAYDPRWLAAMIRGKERTYMHPQAEPVEL